MVFASEFSAPTGGFVLLYAGDISISLSHDHRFVQVSLVRRNGTPALVDSCLVEMLHSSTDCSADDHLVEHGFQQMLIAGAAELEPGNLPGLPSFSLLRVPVAAGST